MRLTRALLCASLFSLVPSLALAEKLNVVTSIRPIESLVKLVAGDHANVTVLVPANSSPHTYSMKPSDAKNLQNADVVFWVDEHLESFLGKSIDTLPKNAHIVTLSQEDGMLVYENREIALSADHHDHEEHDHDKEHHDDEKKEHDDHGHEGHSDHEEHGHDEKHEEHSDHAGHDHHGHDHGAFDMHIWLDPINAKKIASIAADSLAKADPANADQYQANAANLNAELDALIAETEAKLADVKEKHFVTFHDAYQYFEKRFDLHNAGVVTLSPEVKPGAKRLVELKEALKSNEVACVFSEPQFDAKLVQLAVEGTDVRTAELDPLGANLQGGTTLYRDLITQLGDNIEKCLSGTQ